MSPSLIHALGLAHSTQDTLDIWAFLISAKKGEGNRGCRKNSRPSCYWKPEAPLETLSSHSCDVHLAIQAAVIWKGPETHRTTESMAGKALASGSPVRFLSSALFLSKPVTALSILPPRQSPAGWLDPGPTAPIAGAS